MENRDIAAFLEPPLDFKAAGGGDVLQVDAAEAARQQAHGVHNIVHTLGPHAQRNRVHVAKGLEQGAFAFHNGHAGLRADIAQAQYRGAVGDHGHQVGATGQVIAQIHVLLNGEAGLGDAGGIGQGQVVPGVQGGAADHLDFAFPFLVQFQRFGSVIHNVILSFPYYLVKY